MVVISTTRKNVSAVRQQNEEMMANESTIVVGTEKRGDEGQGEHQRGRTLKRKAGNQGERDGGRKESKRYTGTDAKVLTGHQDFCMDGA